jgi:hypothetical protein
MPVSPAAVSAGEVADAPGVGLPGAVAVLRSG